MPRTFVWPYKYGSRSAKLLRDRLNAKFPKKTRALSRLRFRDGDIVVNWGAGSFWGNGVRVLNSPAAVNVASDKLRFFQQSQGQSTYRVPEWTTSRSEAARWDKCVARTLTRASGGRGIVLTERGETIPDAPLYVKYIRKTKEWRIHVAFGQVIDMQRKIKDPQRDVSNWQVRNHENGFIFVRGSGTPNAEAQRQAVAAVRHLGLDFGAVDLIETSSGAFYVLEVNTAPGLEGSTVNHYVQAIQQEVNRHGR